MKKILLIAVVVFASCIHTSAQSNLLDGRKFTIELFIDKQKDATDTLYFENGLANFATAKKYGFAPVTYKAKEKNGYTTFEAIYKSKKNGEMIWEGKVIEDKVEGTMMWDKELQNPVNYTFSTKKEVK